MKTITITAQSADLQSLLDQAREDDVILRAADGSEFMLSAVDDFDHEVARTRQNKKLMALLDERAKQSKVVSLDAVKHQLGLNQ
jgi:hypothetical protein